MNNAQTTRWIAGPRIDLSLLVLAPLIILPVVFLALSGLGVAPRELNAWVFALGAQGHHLPGWLRAYGAPEVFSAYRIRLLVAPVVVISLCVLFALLELHGLVLLAYLWGVWHAIMQTYGVARIYGRFQGAPPALVRADFWLCQIGFVAAVCGSELRLHYIFDLFFRVGLPLPAASMVAQLKTIAWVAGALTLVVWVAIQWRTRHRHQAHPARLILLPTSLAFWWFCNLTVDHMLIGLALFEIFHDLQYLTLVWWVGRTRQQTTNATGISGWLYGRGLRSVAIYVAACLLYGAISSPEQMGDISHRIGLGVLAASQLLHFYYDGFIWRLQAPENATWVQGAKPTKVGASTSRLTYALPLVGLLLVAGSGWLESQRTTKDDATRIIAVRHAVPDNPILQTQYAGLARLQGDPLSALAAYERVLQRLPGYDLALDGRMQAITEAGEAGHLVGFTAEQCLNLDAAELAKHFNDVGVKAAKAKRMQDAMRAWKTAVCLDAALAEAYFNLAGYYARQGNRRFARESVQKGLRLAPDNRQARRLLKLLNSPRE